MIFWRLIILSGENDCKFNYMLILLLRVIPWYCIGHFCIISNVTMVHVAKHGAFFPPSELTREVNCHFFANELGDLQCTSFLFLQLGNYFFLSNNYKPILSVGKGNNLRNANLANTNKCNCHDMNWISKSYYCS